MAPYNTGEISPGPAVETDSDILDWVREDAETALHPSCTCKLGPATDPMAVVDPLTMRVHGVGNIYAPVMMIAEKAADLILGVAPLPPSRLAYYRHGVQPTESVVSNDRE